MRNTICVIGVGNEFRQDDGIGLYVIRELRQRNLRGVTCIEHQREGTGLMDQWEGARSVFLIDAVSSGQAPGTIHRFQIPGDQIPKSILCASTHTFNIADCIELARALHRLPEKIIVYGIEGKSFNIQQDLSEQTMEAAYQVIERIEQEISEHIKSTTGVMRHA